jgi:hypothetical protein
MSEKETVKIAYETVAPKIYFIREQKVMLDRDLAKLYGVATKVLKQSVKRNIGRFPEDFMFEIIVITHTHPSKILAIKPSLTFVFAFNRRRRKKIVRRKNIIPAFINIFLIRKTLSAQLRIATGKNDKRITSNMRNIILLLRKSNPLATTNPTKKPKIENPELRIK